jgi:hypothetical protein
MAATANTTIRDALSATGGTNPYQFRRGSTQYNTVLVMVYGTWTGTIQIQISDPGRNVWNDLDTWTANDARTITPPGDCDLRIYFTRTSGTAIGAIINNA